MKSNINKYYNILSAKRAITLSLPFLIAVLLSITTSFAFSQHPQWIIYTTQNSGLPSHNVSSIVIDTNNVKWVGTDNGLASFDGLNWTVYDTSNSGIPTNYARELAVDRHNNIWLATTGKGLVKFDRLNWIVYNINNSGLPTNTLLSIAIDSSNNKWIGTVAKGVVKYDDLNWIIYDTVNSGLQENSVWCTAIEGYIKWFGTSGSGIAKFNDTNWVVYNRNNSGLPSNFTRSLFIDSFGNKWIGTANGGAVKFNSNNNSWVIYDVIWPGLPGNYVSSLLVDNNNIKWFGTNGGLAKYNDTNIIVYGPPLSGFTFLDLKIDKFGNLWIAFIEGVAIHNPNGIVNISNNIFNIPNNYQLFQNYPNPYNSLTNIQYSINKKCYVQIKIFDLLGREINSLINNDNKSGNYEVLFDGTNLASGTYFYSLIVNEKIIETKRMVILK